jgi:uroporphyrinogen-III synthase
MDRQSHLPAILLTRPLMQSRRFARQLRMAADGPLHIRISPLMNLVYLDIALPATAINGLIFTSEAGVSAYLQQPVRLTVPAWCVGRQTAKLARKAGLETVFTAKDAADLIAHIKADMPVGPFLHLRGEDSHGDVAGTLTKAGLKVDQVIVYAQRPLPLAARAAQLLQAGSPLIVPLFSARSAKLFLMAAPKDSAFAVAALSPAVAAVIPEGRASRLVIAPSPDGPAMVQTVLSLLREPTSA